MSSRCHSKLSFAVRDFIINDTNSSSEMLSKRKSSALRHIVKLACVKAVDGIHDNNGRLGRRTWLAENLDISRGSVRNLIRDKDGLTEGVCECSLSSELVNQLSKVIPHLNFVKSKDSFGFVEYDINLRKIQNWLIAEVLAACRFNCQGWGSVASSRVLGVGRSTQLSVARQYGYPDITTMFENHEFSLAYTSAFQNPKTRSALKQIIAEAMREQIK